MPPSFIISIRTGYRQITVLSCFLSISLNVKPITKIIIRQTKPIRRMPSLLLLRSLCLGFCSNCSLKYHLMHYKDHDIKRLSLSPGFQVWPSAINHRQFSWTVAFSHYDFNHITMALLTQCSLYIRLYIMVYLHAPLNLTILSTFQ